MTERTEKKSERGREQKGGMTGTQTNWKVTLTSKVKESTSKVKSKVGSFEHVPIPRRLRESEGKGKGKPRGEKKRRKAKSGKWESKSQRVEESKSPRVQDRGELGTGNRGQIRERGDEKEKRKKKEGSRDTRARTREKASGN